MDPRRAPRFPLYARRRPLLSRLPRPALPARRPTPETRRRFLLAAVMVYALGLACRSAQPPTVGPPPPTPQTPPPTPIVAPPPSTVPPPPPPLPVGPLHIRVGLASDLERFELPADAAVTIHAAGLVLPLEQSMAFQPWEEVRRRRVLRLQVAALKDEIQAQNLAASLAERSAAPCDAAFDADSDLYKVRCGAFTLREEADAFRGRLAALGADQAWVSAEGGDLENPGFELLQDKLQADGTTRRERRVVPGRWVEIRQGDAERGLRVDGTAYRGRLLLYLNERGLLNVINEIELEAYLRGVVPKEMGPELYPELEALKAQAVAARTYTVRHLDEFADEGYDICSTPRCQVYGGLEVEHALADRAIRDTDGIVVLEGGAPAETFYSSTCGGHTEDVEVIFPRQTGAHLRGVPCIEASLASGAATLGGDLPPGTRHPDGVVRRLLPPSSGPPPQVLEARLEHLAILAGLPVPHDDLASLERRELTRFTTSLFDMALDGRLFTGEADLAELLAAPPAEWQPRDLHFANYLAESGLLHDPSGELAPNQVESLLYRLALYLGVLRVETAGFSEFDGTRLTVRDPSGTARTLEIPSRLATFRPLTPGGPELAGPVELMPGDQIRLEWDRSRLLAITRTHAARPVRLRANQAPRQSWTLRRDLAEVRDSVRKRYPGFPFKDFEILSRGVSGRVGLMRLIGDGGETLLVQGLAVRWTLDIWDTWFDAEPWPGPGGSPGGWTFDGHGWGHGVGMCQAGSYAMAARGLGYRDILEHYYSGVELGRVRLRAPRVRPSGVAAGR